MSAVLEEDDSVSWPQQKIPIIARTGVLVCGGGTAGIAAAVAAGRAGADVLLLEKNGFLGGAITAVGMAQWGAAAVGMAGITAELLQRLLQAGAAIEGSVIPIDPEAFKDVAFEMVSEAGVRTLLYTEVLDVVMEGDLVRGVVVQTKSGPRAILANITIDTTGDADIAFRAGAPYVKGRESDGKMRPITLLFRLGNVDIQRVAKFAKEHPEDFLEDPDRNVIDLEHGRLRLVGYFSQVQAAKALGKLDAECHYIRLEDVFPDRRMVTVNTTRVYGVDGTDPFDLTKAAIEGRKQMHQLVDFLRRYAPGLESCFLVDSAPFLGVRETRRIIGEYVLTEGDIASDKTFPDSIGRMYMRHVPGHDVHSPDGREGAPEDRVYRSRVDEVIGYNFPYRCMVPQRIDALLVAGRCASVTQEADRWTRNQPPCLLMGQAAGAAAAMAVLSSTQPRAINVQRLQQSLQSQGINIDVAAK